MKTFVLILALLTPAGHITPHTAIAKPMTHAECAAIKDHPIVRASYLEDYWGDQPPDGDPILICRELHDRAYKMRVTGYYAAPGALTALNEPAKAGQTAAVSQNCLELLDSKVYVKGYGVWHVNDITADWVGEKFGMCTIDLAQPSIEAAKKIGAGTTSVTRVNK